MTVTHVLQGVRRRRVGLLVSLLWLLTPWWGACAQESKPVAQALPPAQLEQRLHVTVQQGQLSVQLQEADVGEVLAVISQQAGIRLVVCPASGIRISTQFTGLALEDGLRRLLRLAGLSYAIVYAKGSVGVRPIQAVRVLGAAGAEPTRPAPEPPHVFAEPQDTGDQRDAEAVMAALATAQRPDGEEESEIAGHLQVLLTWVSEHSDTAQSLAVPPEANEPYREAAEDDR